jgi:hypothetical protein
MVLFAGARRNAQSGTARSSSIERNDCHALRHHYMIKDWFICETSQHMIAPERCARAQSSGEVI